MALRHVGCKKPRGCLMIEHRLIERVLGVVEREKARLEAGGELDPVLLDRVVDFIKTYADRTHHGKEEDILFTDLEEKQLSDDEKRLMQELVEEHKIARRYTNELVGAKDAYLAGDTGRLADVLDRLGRLLDLYPQHIEKEDKQFFPETERHYTKEDLDAMLREFYDFDMRMIHEKYDAVVEAMEQKGR